MSTTATVIVARQPILCEGFRRLLDQTSFEIVGDFRNLSDAAATITAGLQVQLVLSEAYDDLGELLRFTRRLTPWPKIVVLASPHERLSENFPFSEINGLLCLYISPNSLIRSLELVMSEDQVFPIHVGFLTANSVTEAPSLRKTLEDLSDREIEILAYLTLGYSNKSIARQLDVAETTIKAHVKAILRKTNTGNRTQAAMWSVDHGITLDTLPSSQLAVSLPEDRPKRPGVLLQLPDIHARAPRSSRHS
jgi:two-component system nitrate/nitrite response regulator NarL